MILRPASEQDLPAIAEIQAAAIEASQWNPEDYLAHNCEVAVVDGAVVGFLVARPVAEKEWEILNLAVAPRARRKGVGRQLLRGVLSRYPGDFFLELRESNLGARAFYEHLGFEVVASRTRYYSGPEESALVMKFQSC